MTNLRPCPFCGGKVRFHRYSAETLALTKQRGGVAPPMVRCDGCGAMVSFDETYATVLREEAAKRWNRRAIDAD